MLERLETAHTATIEWLMTRLGEVAVGGPPALRPTPAQAIVGVSRRLGSLPARQTAGVLNRTVEQAGRLGDRAGSVVSTNVARTRELLEAAVEIWTAGRDASLKRSEQLAAERGDRDTARSVHRTRSELGALDTGELPIRGYDRLNAGVTIDRIRRFARRRGRPGDPRLRDGEQGTQGRHPRRPRPRRAARRRAGRRVLILSSRWRTPAAGSTTPPSPARAIEEDHASTHVARTGWVALGASLAPADRHTAGRSSRPHSPGGRSVIDEPVDESGEVRRPRRVGLDGGRRRSVAPGQAGRREMSRHEREPR